MHSLSCFVGLVDVFCSLCLAGFLPVYFLCTVGNRVSVSPFFVNIICSVFTDQKKKKEKKRKENDVFLID